jgi:hypothetical protein
VDAQHKKQENAQSGEAAGNYKYYYKMDIYNTILPGEVQALESVSRHKQAVVVVYIPVLHTSENMKNEQDEHCGSLRDPKLLR